MKRSALFFSLLFVLLPQFARAQSATLWPFAQLFDNSGAPLQGCQITFYSAGTTSVVPTYTNSSATTVNPSPFICDGAGRVISSTSQGIWLTGGPFRFVIQDKNGVIVASADNYSPGGGGGGGGGVGNCSSITNGIQCGIFQSATSSPSTSGVIRLASADTQCWAGVSVSFLCLTHGTNDQLTWGGNSFMLTAGNCFAGAAGITGICADNSTGRLAMLNNGGAKDQVVGQATVDSLSNKTLTSPTITNPSTTGTDSGSETLQNKTITSPTISSPTINTSIPNGTGFQRAASGSTAMGANAETTVTVNWETAWADTGYYTVCTLSGMTASLADVFMGGVITQTTTSVTVSIYNNNGVSLNRAVNCIGVHP